MCCQTEVGYYEVIRHIKVSYYVVIEKDYCPVFRGLYGCIDLSAFVCVVSRQRGVMKVAMYVKTFALTLNLIHCNNICVIYLYAVI